MPCPRLQSRVQTKQVQMPEPPLSRHPVEKGMHLLGPNSVPKVWRERCTEGTGWDQG